MNIFTYDKSFEGLLTCVFDAYFRKVFPDVLIEEGDTLPLFYEEHHSVATDTQKAERVWKGLEKKLSPEAREQVALCFMADEYPKIDELVFRYIRKAIDGPAVRNNRSLQSGKTASIELNFGDPDVLEMMRVYKQVTYEAQRMRMFVRFQKAADGTYFAPFEPQHNVLPLAVEHFRDRFGDQKWIIYDIKRGYGYHFDLNEVHEVTFNSEEEFLKTGLLDEKNLDPDEILLQNMWKAYFSSICIRERMNPRKHKHDMPVRYWKHITEKQKSADKKKAPR